MSAIRRYLKPVGLLVIFAMVTPSLPHAPARAAMVSTDRILDEAAGDVDRDRIRDFLRREDVQAQIRTQGVDPVEVVARVDALSDREVTQIAERLDELPAGGVLGYDDILIGGFAILFLGILIIVVYAGIVFLFINIMESD